MNHSRSCPDDSLPRASSELRAGGGAAAAARTAFSRPRGVGSARKPRSAMPSAPNWARASATTRMACNESPPAAKKFSSGPVCATPSAAAISARACSSSAAGSGPLPPGSAAHGTVRPVGQRPQVRLARRVGGHAVEHGQPLRHQVGGDQRPELAEDAGRLLLPRQFRTARPFRTAAQRDEGAQFAVGSHAGRGGHGGHPQQLRLHLAQLDPVAPELDLTVAAAKVVQRAVGGPAHRSPVRYSRPPGSPER